MNSRLFNILILTSQVYASSMAPARGQAVSPEAFAQDPQGFFHEVIVVNTTSSSVFIKVVPKKEVMSLQGAQFELAPNSTAVIGNYTDPNGFVSSVDVMTVTGSTRNRKGKAVSVPVLMMEKKQVDATHRTYIYQTTGGGGSVGFTF